MVRREIGNRSRTLSYTSGVLMSATIGSVLAQQYAYTSGYLTAITDGAGNTIAGFAYAAASGGQVARVSTSRGGLAFDYAPSRTGCTGAGNTMMYFNQVDAGPKCADDSSCSGGAMCGGVIGGTGVCYAAGRCLALGTANGESVVTGTTAVSTGGGCTGACADVLAYVWSSTSGLINALGTEDAAGRYTSAAYNSNGLPTQIVEADNDTNATNTNPSTSRTTYLIYDTTYPGRLAEVRHQSNLDTADICTATSTTGCARTIYTYNTTSPYLLHTVVDSGWTLNSTASNTTYSYTTTYTQDTQGRTTEIDGPLSGAKTVYDYYSSTDPTKNGFLQDIKRYKSSSAYLEQSMLAYDIWGHVTGSSDANGAVRCDTYDSSRAYLAQTRFAMSGQTDCTTSYSTDLTTNYVRDSALRLTEMQRPDSSCVLNAYDTLGRLSTVQRRDDCSSKSTGDYLQYTYSNDAQVTEVDTYNAAGTITRKQPYTYYDGRQLASVINPVTSTSDQTMSYDASGMATGVQFGYLLGGETYTYGNGDTRLTGESKTYDNSGGSDSWSFAYAFQGEQSAYTDGVTTPTVTVSSIRDDKGREVQRKSVDFPSATSTLLFYDAAGNLTSKVEDYAGTAPVTSTYTYDYLNRRLTATYSGTGLGSGSGGSGSGAGSRNSNPFTTWSYDTLPTGVSCPTAMGSLCTNGAGHVLYVTTSLVCSSSFSDNSLDQQTYYSYDAHGRELEEYITDDSSRVADHRYTWTANGALTQVTLPSSATIGWTFGSTGNNSDTDLVTGIYRTSTSTPVIDSAAWNPFGPLASYDQENLYSNGQGEFTQITRNLAYRISDIRIESWGSTHPPIAKAEVFGLAITEDAKGRVTARDYADNSYGVQDSFFTYDLEDRVVCETTTSEACPTTGGATVKNSHFNSPPFTAAGDWKGILRPIPGGGSSYENDFTLTTGTHQISSVAQTASGLGTTYFSYDARGNRSADTNSTETHANRTYTYDARGNVINVRGQLYTGSAWHYYDVGSTFDARNRRVSKTVYDETALTTASWFFYYDALDRLTEVRWTPNTASPSTYDVYQIIWLGDRVVAFWETDYPSATTSRRYAATDETGRIVDMESWPASGDGSRVWALNPSAWGYDQAIIGWGSVFQPLVFPGQYADVETTLYNNSGSTYARPGIVLNGYRSYDPFTSGYLQVDPMVPSTQSSYVYVHSDPVGKSDPLGRSDDQGVPKDDGYTDGGDLGYWGFQQFLSWASSQDGAGDGEGEGDGDGGPDLPWPTSCYASEFADCLIGNGANSCGLCVAGQGLRCRLDCALQFATSDPVSLAMCVARSESLQVLYAAKCLTDSKPNSSPFGWWPFVQNRPSPIMGANGTHGECGLRAATDID